MTTLTTKLVQDGNSMALRLPKQVLMMSGLNGVIQLTVRKGQIVLRAPRNPRAGWSQRIKQEIDTNGPLVMIDKYGDMLEEIDATLNDGLGR
jgi:antitoxin component of MazEF toxin-antitoxin module